MRKNAEGANVSRQATTRDPEPIVLVYQLRAKILEGTLKNHLRDDMAILSIRKR